MWSLLLSLGSYILSKPSRSGKRHTLVSIIRKRLSNIDSVGNTSVNHRSAKPNKGCRTPSLANLVANKMEDCDTTTAIRLICSKEKPVYDSEEVYVKLTERYSEEVYVKLSERHSEEVFMKLTERYSEEVYVKLSERYSEEVYVKLTERHSALNKDRH